MSEPITRTHGWLALAAAVALAAAPRVATAQDAAAEREALRARLERSIAAADAAGERFRELRDGGANHSASMTEGPITVRSTPTALGGGNRERLAAGIRQGLAELERRFGVTGLALVDTATWYLDAIGSSDRDGYVLGRTQQAWMDGARLRSPIPEATVAAFVVDRATRNLRRVAPVTISFTSGALLVATERNYEEAARELALGWSSIGNACAAGTLQACRAVFTDAADARAALHLYFTPRDHQSLVVSFGQRAQPRDSAWWSARGRCLKGDMADCSRLANEEGGAYPFTGNVRGTLVAHALELGGRESLERLRAASAAGVAPLAALATAAGTTSDELIASWQSRTASALQDARGSGVPLALTTTFWCGLLLLGATRRKP